MSESKCVPVTKEEKESMLPGVDLNVWQKYGLWIVWGAIFGIGLLQNYSEVLNQYRESEQAFRAIKDSE